MSGQLSRIERLKDIQEASQLDAFLFTSAQTITWLSGYFYNFETGSSPFQLLPAALLMVPSKKSILILADNESFSSNGIGSDVEVKLYSSYVYEKSLDFTPQFLLKLCEAISENGLSGAIIGIEQNSLPYVVAQTISSAFPGIKIRNVSDELIPIKAIKDPDEIDCIRKATALCDIGQAAVLKHARVGMTELELFSLIRTEMEATVGTRLPLMLDLVCGARTEEGGGNPSNKIIQQGNLILSDLTPCLNGYWGDTCNTMVVGKPTDEQRRNFKQIEEALKLAINFIRPGVKAMEVDQLLRNHLANICNYGHHSGHGVGTNYHEEPRIVPCNEMILEANMVIALEPAIYTNGYGIRLEHLVLVTKSGCETLSKFKHCLEQDL
jgi:Xaa-Pro dipeptidase